MSDDDYEVGRGRPPKHAQFQKGHSGNPRGRPKGARNVSTIIVSAAREKVVTTQDNGRRKTMTKLDVAVTQAFNKAAKGDLASIKFVLGLVERAQAAIEAQVGPSDPVEQRVRDKALIEGLRRQLLGNQGGGDGAED